LVCRPIEDDLERRDQAALDRAKARAEQAERDAEAEDDRVIAVMNARRSPLPRAISPIRFGFIFDSFVMTDRMVLSCRTASLTSIRRG
jgi:hypothetical protein